MDRLRPPPTNLLARVLVLCGALALVLRWRQGGETGDVPAVLLGAVRLDAIGLGALRLLLGPVVSSFLLVSLALATGLSFALALAMLVSRLGARAGRFAGWLGVALTHVPPMAWALGAIVWLIRFRGLPVETLYPFPASWENDSPEWRMGRILWSWLVPAWVLATPVFGVALFSLTHRLGAMVSDPALGKLRSRGLTPSQILYRHFVPRLRVHLARLGRPCAAALLVADIPVEELLGFDGWGRMVASRLQSPAVDVGELAVLFWTGAWILAGVLGWLFLLDRRGLPQEAEELSDSSQRRSRRSVRCGWLLVLLLLVPPRWLGAADMVFQEAHHAAWLEIPRALAVALAALALMLGASWLISPARSRLFQRGWAAAFAIVPLPLVLLLWERQEDRNWMLVVLAAAVPGMTAFREAFRDADSAGFIEVARTLGQKPWRIWRLHVLPNAAPGLLQISLRQAGAVLLLLALLDFYSASAAPGWGRMMRLGAERALDDPLPALAPAAWLALWSLSFRLLSRGFHAGPPETPTPPLHR